MKIFIIPLFLFFAFELTAKEIQYACSEWEIKIYEYATDSPFGEKAGTPFIGKEFNNQFTLKNKLGTTKTLKFIGIFNAQLANS